MVFNSPLFLFLFLPLLLLFILFIAPRSQKGFLIFCSLFLYIWAENRTAWILLLIIAISYISARAMAAAKTTRKKSAWLTVGIGANLTLLFICKYAAFFIRNLNPILGSLGLEPLAEPRLPLPLGISFATFLAISFLIDTSRAHPAAKPKLADASLYISFFPTIIAGPITPYREMAPQLESHDSRVLRLHEGIQRFIIGLGKKVLIADLLAKTANPIFVIPGADLTFAVAWLGIIAFTFQIYFDFSGYTDMAVGLGQIFGFRFMENFNYPYAATSIQDFWTRWHKSLTRWLRDYLFLPLAYRVLRIIKMEKWLGIKAESWAYGIGMFLTMLLCGTWHGAAWTFIFWGFYHAVFMLLERFVWGRRLKKTWRPLRHAYAVLLVAIGWVFFRSANLAHAFSFLRALAGLNHGNPQVYHPSLYKTKEMVLVLLVAFFGAMPLVPAGKRLLTRWQEHRASWSRAASAWIKGLVFFLFLVAVLFLSCLYLANETYQPFIYFRF